MGISFVSRGPGAKPVYDALDRLINREWSTSAVGRTDDAGQWQFRGFRGRYELTVNGKTLDGKWWLTQSSGTAPAQWTVRLPR